jgi:hypothetical protein
MQILRITQAYMPVAQAIDAKAVELELAATIAPGWKLTGHIDLYTHAQEVDDLKTGAVRRPYQAQLGGYSLLAKSNGMPVKGVGITFVPRGKKTKPQPPAERQPYNIAVAEKAAYATINQIRADVEKFQQTGDPYSFPANPMSLMCSAKYCPAHGTKFCKLHISKTNEEYDDRPID